MELAVRYELDRDGWWVASVPTIPGCHTQGRTLPQARGRIRECLALYMPKAEADAARFIDEISLPPQISEAFRKISEYGIHHGVDVEILLDSQPS